MFVQLIFFQIANWLIDFFLQFYWALSSLPVMPVMASRKLFLWCKHGSSSRYSPNQFSDGGRPSLSPADTHTVIYVVHGQGFGNYFENLTFKL